jgi:tetratricopeptide (TPR) repeat protein
MPRFQNMRCDQGIVVNNQHNITLHTMESNQDNKVVQLCAKGMELEGQGKLAEAAKHFEKAWDDATTDFEKFTAAHYVARHQKSIADKLKWDKTALTHALNITDESIKETLPSLYLNIGKCYEDLNHLENAKSNYQAALSFSIYLPDDGYGNMIKGGIDKGLSRTTNR